MEEISLKEIIQTLARGSRMILAITGCAVILACGLYLGVPKQFKAVVTLKASPIDINPKIAADATALIGDIASVATFPVMDINSYTEQLTNNTVLARTISKMDLRGKNGELLQPDDLKTSITVKSDEKTGILSVTTVGDSPTYAADLGNTLVAQFTQYLSETIGTSCSDITENVNKQLGLQKEKIDIETGKLKNYAESPHNPLELDSAIRSQIAQITRYKADLNDLQRSINTDTTALQSLKTIGSENAPSQLKINMPSSVYAGSRSKDPNDAVPVAGAASSIEISVDGSASVGNSVLSIRKAETEARLVQNAADYLSLTTRLNEMENTLSQLQSTLADEQQKYDIIQRDYKLAGEIYGSYQKLLQQVSVIASMDLAKRNILILSQGVPPSYAENMSLALYAAIGLTLGLFIAVFVVLFKSYWSQTPNAT